jgi:DNA-directed RNA polymerase omega subunit
MLHPSMTELLEKVDNRYLLVNVAAKRARQIAEEAEINEVKLSEKPVKLALDDIVSGKIVNTTNIQPNAVPVVTIEE